jgi:hypothetical protein
VGCAGWSAGDVPGIPTEKTPTPAPLNPRTDVVDPHDRIDDVTVDLDDPAFIR